MQIESNVTEKTFLLPVVALLGCLFITPLHAQTIPPPTLSNNCAGCHGTLGYSAEPMPIIAGLSEAYFKQVMRQFKSGKRPSTIMGRLTRGYTDKDIDDMAGFFASQLWI